MTRRPYWLAVCVAVTAAVVAIGGALVLDLPLRDPDGVAGPSYVRLPLIVLLAVGADIVPRAWYRTPTMRQFFRTATLITKERWSWARFRLVIIGLGCFYLSYVAYRNLKSFLGILTEPVADPWLASFDQFLLFGHRPAVVLHELLGTGVAAHALSGVYVVYLFVVPVSLAAALAWSRDVHKGFWVVTALCLNWVLGAISYFILPSYGPVYTRVGDFTDLPDTGAGALQTGLFLSSTAVTADPFGTASVHGIAAFASLHVSVVFSLALIVHRLGMPRWFQGVLWVYFGLTTVATLYFGWHYIADDLAGMLIGYLAVVAGAWATGFPAWSLRRIPPEQQAAVEAQTSPDGGTAPAEAEPVDEHTRA